MPDKNLTCIYPCRWKTNGLLEGLNGKWKNGRIETCVEENLWILKLFENINAKSSRFAFQLTSKIVSFHQQKNRIIIKMKDLEIHMIDIKTEDGVQIIGFLADAQKSGNTNNFNDNFSTPLKQSSCQPFSPINSSQNTQFSTIKKLHENEDEENSFIIDTSKSLENDLISSAKAKANNCLPSSSFYQIKSESTPFAPRNSYKSKRKPGLLPYSEQDLKRPKFVRSFLTKPTPLDNMLKVKPNASLQGFSNLGNTCYMNSILQSLFCLDTFATNLNNVYRSSSCQPNHYLLHISLGQLLQSSLHNKYDNNRAHLLSNVKESICKTAKRFIGNEQHDAHEFLGQLLDQLSEEVEKINQNNLEKNIMTKLDNPTTLNFESSIKQKITCSNCSFVHEMTLTQNDISVNFSSKHKLRSIQDCLKMYFEEQDVEFTCEKCNQTEGRVSYSFSKVPRVLIILLKRYQYSSVTSTQEKVASKVVIPKFVSIKNHCTEETVPPMSAPFPCREFSFKNHKSNMKDSLNNVSNQRTAFSDKSNNDCRIDVSTPKHLPNKLMYEGESPSIFNQDNSSYCQYTDFDEAYIASLSEEDQLIMAIERSKNEISPDLGLPIKNYNRLFDFENTDSLDDNSTPIQTINSCKQLPLTYDSETPKLFQNDGFASDLCMDVDTNKENVEPLFYDAKMNVDAKLEEPNADIFNSINGATSNNVNLNNQVISTMDNLNDSNKEFKAKSNKNNISVYKEDWYNEASPKSKLAASLNHEPTNLHHRQSDAEPMEDDFLDLDTNINQFDSDLKRAIELSLSMNHNNELEESDIMTNIKEKELDEETKTLNNNFETGDLPFSYQLVSVVSHLGSTSSVGHYVADIYDAQHKKWNLCDDSCVTSTSEKEVRLKREKTGYIFFYLAKDLMSDIENFYKQNGHY